MLPQDVKNHTHIHADHCASDLSLLEAGAGLDNMAKRLCTEKTWNDSGTSIIEEIHVHCKF